MDAKANLFVRKSSSMFDFWIRKLFTVENTGESYCTLVIHNAPQKREKNFTVHGETSNFIIREFLRNLWQLTKWIFLYLLLFLRFHGNIRQETWNFCYFLFKAVVMSKWNVDFKSQKAKNYTILYVLVFL
jgi:hypothetical protein